MVSEVLSFYATRKAARADGAHDNSLTYVLAFAALGMFAATMALTFGLDFGSF
jgi:hypothetical protein